MPYSRGDLLSRVHELGASEYEEYTEKGAFVRGRVPSELLNRLEPYFTPEFAEAKARQDQARQTKRKAYNKTKQQEGEEEIDWVAIAKKRKSM